MWTKVKNLVISDEGVVKIAGRRVYPDRNGSFPANDSGEMVTKDEIIRACGGLASVANGLIAQTKHSNYTIDELMDWKERFNINDPKTHN